MSGVNYILWMHFVAMKAWTLTHSSVKNKSKNVRKKGRGCSKLSACPRWWRQTVRDPQRADGVRGPPRARTPSAAAPRRAALASTALRWERKEKNNRSPVNVISPPAISVPRNILNCPCCNFAAVLYVSGITNSKGECRTWTHTHTRVYPPSYITSLSD